MKIGDRVKHACYGSGTIECIRENKVWFKRDNSEYMITVERQRLVPIPEEPEQPEYKLFELDWTTYDWPILRGSENTWVDLGRRIDGYRIFGYTNNEHAVEKIFIDYSCQPYYEDLGKMRYAIGKLEVQND